MEAGCNLLRFTFPQQPKGIETEKGVIPSEIEKEKYKNDILVIADLCNCSYTSHGHCGTIVDGDVDIT